MSIVERMLSTDVKKPTALTHFRRVVPVPSQKILTILTIHAQVVAPDKDGMRWLSMRLLSDIMGRENSNNFGSEADDVKLAKSKIARTAKQSPSLWDYFMLIYENDIDFNYLGVDRTISKVISKRFLIGKGWQPGLIGYQLHPDYEEIIKNPALFAKMRLMMMSLLSEPKYAFPMYELAADIASRGVEYQDMMLDDFRMLIGATSKAYDDYIELNKKVIKPNTRAVNEVSDYDLQFKTIRESRRVVGVRVFSKRKTHWQQPLLFDKPLDVVKRYLAASDVKDVVEDDREAIAAITSHGVDEQTARQAVEKYGVAGALEIRAYVLAQVKRRGSAIEDVTKYMANALRKGHGRKTPEQHAKEAAQQADKEQHGKRDRARTALEAIGRTVKSRRAAAVKDRVEAAKHDPAILAEFKETRNDFHQKQLEAGSWKGLETSFIKFIAEKHLGAEIDALRAYATERGHNYDQLLKDAEL